MSEGSSEASSGVTHSKRSMLSSLFKGKGDSKENVATPNTNTLKRAQPDVDAKKLQRTESLLSPMRKRQSTIALVPVQQSQLTFSSALSTTNCQTLPAQEPTDDTNKAQRPEQRRALELRLSSLANSKAIMEVEIAKIVSEMRDVKARLEKLKVLDDIDVDGGGSATSQSFCVQRDDASKGSTRSNRSLFGRKQKPEQQPQSQLQTIAEIVQQQGVSVPVVIQKACDFLRKPEHLDIEGIFRVSPNERTVRSIIEQMSNGQFQDFSSSAECKNDPHVVASILKKFFSSLAEPLITSEAFLCLKTISKKTQGQIDTNSVREVLDKVLPQPNRHVLHFLVQLLVQVSAHSSENKMNAANLGTVFGPTLCGITSDDISSTAIMCELIAFMINNYQTLFECIPSQVQQQQQHPRVANLKDDAEYGSAKSTSSPGADAGTSVRHKHPHHHHKPSAQSVQP